MNEVTITLPVHVAEDLARLCRNRAAALHAAADIIEKTLIGRTVPDPPVVHIAQAHARVLNTPMLPSKNSISEAIMYAMAGDDADARPTFTYDDLAALKIKDPRPHLNNCYFLARSQIVNAIWHLEWAGVVEKVSVRPVTCRLSEQVAAIIHPWKVLKEEREARKANG